MTFNATSCNIIGMSMTMLVLAFASATKTFNLPEGLLSSLCYVESHHNPSAVHKDDGRGNSVGVCQIKIETARGLGFKGTEKDLLNPSINVYYSGKYLSKQLNRYGQNVPKAVAAYNAGSFRPSNNGQAKNHLYVTKVYASWKQRK